MMTKGLCVRVKDLCECVCAMQRIMRKSGICPLVERENKIDVLMGF
jgi:hypothetical protein